MNLIRETMLRTSPHFIHLKRILDFGEAQATKSSSSRRRKCDLTVVSLAAQVRHGAQGVIEAVGEIRRANHQCELDDLPLIEKFSQLREGGVADRRSAARDAFGMQNYCLVLVIEQRAALVE